MPGAIAFGDRIDVDEMTVDVSAVQKKITEE